MRDFEMERKKLLFISPPKEEGNDELHLTIKRIEYVKNTSVRKETPLYDDCLPYAAHGKEIFLCKSLYTCSFFFEVNVCVPVPIAINSPVP